MLTRDIKTCNGCSICSEVCPVGAIQAFNRGDADPEGCVRCGQCEAFCPKGAMHVESPELMPYANPIDHAPISPEQMSFHLANRRSVRNFKPTPVERATLERLLETARFAPTGNNAQSVAWLVINDAERLHGILDAAASWMQRYMESTPDSPWNGMFAWVVDTWRDGKDAIFRGAPHLAVAYGPSSARTIMTDAAIAASYLELAAPSFGIGACWGGIFMIAASMSGEVRRELGLTDEHTVGAALMLGHPALKPHHIPKRQAPKVRWL